METSLHRELKALYAPDETSQEVSLDGFRIDAVADDELVEIQHSSLSAIRRKVQQLTESHRVKVVKPIIVTKTLVKREAKDAPVISRRQSPKRGKLLDLFDELVHFTGAFPHERLVLEVPLVDVEEWRYPGHGRRRRRRGRDHQVEDVKLIAVREVHCFRTAADLTALVPRGLPRPFHTGHLAERLGVQRWIAQRIAYCFRKMGAARTVGKDANALLYELSVPQRRRPRRKRSA